MASRQNLAEGPTAGKAPAKSDRLRAPGQNHLRESLI